MPSGSTLIVPSRFSDHDLALSTNTYSAFGIAVMLPSPMRAPAPRKKLLLSVYQPPVAWRPTGPAQAAVSPPSESSAARVAIRTMRDIGNLRVMDLRGAPARLEVR